MTDKDIKGEFDRLHKAVDSIFQKLFMGNGNSLTTQVTLNTNARVKTDKRTWAVFIMLGSIMIGAAVKWVWFS